jgi:hypothetical protein
MKTNDQPADGPFDKKRILMWNPGNFGSFRMAFRKTVIRQKARMKRLSAFMGGVILVLTLAGCATTPPPLKGSPDLLNFLSDGKTTRTKAISTLGQPSGAFDSQRILTYRLGYEPKNNGYYVVEREATASGWPTWTAAKFSLVLVFDDAGILRRHSLVKVNQ